MGISDRSFVGNEVPEDAADFSFEDDDPPVSREKRGVRRRTGNSETDADSDLAECGVCSSLIAIDASECNICGAQFE